MSTSNTVLLLAMGLLLILAHTPWPHLLWRRLNQLYAWFFGYFWAECPRCGKMWGGHEWKDNEIVKLEENERGILRAYFTRSVCCQHDDHTGHGTCCDAPEERDDAAVCARAHERRGESERDSIQVARQRLR